MHRLAMSSILTALVWITSLHTAYAATTAGRSQPKVTGGPLSNVLVNGTVAANLEGSPTVGAIGNNLVAAYLRRVGTTTRIAYATSIDGGATFTEVGDVPSFSGYNWRQEPRVAVNSTTGEYWLLGLTSTSGPSRVRLTVVRGSFSGSTFTWGTPVFVGGDIIGGSIILSAFLSIDVDPTTNIALATFSDFYASNTLQVFRSTDGGATWGALSGVPNLYNQTVAFGVSGEVYIVGRDIASTLTYRCVRSDNPGDATPTWSTSTVAANVPINLLSQPGLMTNIPRPSLAIDRTDGPQRGRLHLGWAQPSAFDQQPRPDTLDAMIQRLEVEPNDVAGQENALTLGTVTRATIGTNTDVDLYELSLSAGDQVVVACDSVPVGDFLDLRVLAPDGTQRLGSVFAFIDQGVFLFGAPSAGDYVLRVARSSGITPYGYRFSVSSATMGSPGRDTRDVMTVHSDDGGATWSPPVRVNDDPASFDDGFPTLAVGADGCPHAWWPDLRDDLYGTRTHVYLSRSDDGGDTWRPSCRITTDPTNWSTATSGLSSVSYGDMAASGPLLHLIWADARSGTPDVYSGTLAVDFDLSACTPGSMVEREDVVAIGTTITNHNPLFSNDYVVTLTDQRAWPMPSSGSASATASGTTSPSLNVTVPDTAAAGVNVVTIHVTTPQGTLEHTCDVALDVQGTTAVARGAARFALESGHPNPARGSTVFAYQLPRAERATLAVYGLRGETVRTLVDAERSAGANSARWDGRDASGRQAAPGAYYVRLTAGGRVAQRRFVFLR